MGLFSFLKNAGSKVMTKKNVSTVDDAEVKKMQAELERKQKMILLRGVIDSLGIPMSNMEVDLNGDKVTVYGKAKSQAEKEKIILALGNVAGISEVDDRISVTKKAPEAQFYTVKKGDTLGKISKAVYGNSKLYKEIFEANKPMLKSANLIYPGQVLRIPPVKK